MSNFFIFYFEPFPKVDIISPNIIRKKNQFLENMEIFIRRERRNTKSKKGGKLGGGENSIIILLFLQCYGTFFLRRSCIQGLAVRRVDVISPNILREKIKFLEDGCEKLFAC